MDGSQKVEISAVIPIFNEEENLPVLIPRVIEVFDHLSKVYEVICVDDESADGSGKILRKIAIQHPTLRVLGS